MSKKLENSYFNHLFCRQWTFYLFLRTSLLISNSCLFYSYNVITNLLDKFSLIVEHSKSKVFHFSRLHGLFNPPPLDLLP